MTDALGGETATTYDAVGNVIATSDTLGRVTTNTYDNLDRLVTNTAPDPDGATGAGTAPVTGLEYDLVGNLVKITDALGHATTFTYRRSRPALRRPRMHSEAPPRRSTTPSGTPPPRSDVLGRRTTFKFDALRRLVETTQPDPDGSWTTVRPGLELRVRHRRQPRRNHRCAGTRDVLHVRRAQPADEGDRRRGRISETLYDAAGRVWRSSTR